MQPDLSIVIVNWNTRDMLRDALNSLLQPGSDLRLQVIVVDNASVDGSAAMVRSEFPMVKLVANTGNAGYAEGNNQGMRVAEGRHTLLLNPDVVVPPGTLEGAVHALETDPKIGALGCRLIGTDGETQRSVRGFPTPGSILWEALGLSRLCPSSPVFGAYRMTTFDYSSQADVDQPMGTFLLLRGEAVRQVGLLDERFPIFFNEVDWCYRAKRGGWRIVYTPTVQIKHYGGASTGQVAPAMAWESRRGLLAYYRKHYGGLRYAPIRALATAASWVQAWRLAARRGAQRNHAA
ncbi:MAG: glycosyltransferase family 2 protein [Armatimonadetes bacterium]|nr:glycosyltransferase family 2 protein [Armatimonadota bacterium]